MGLGLQLVHPGTEVSVAEVSVPNTCFYTSMRYSSYSTLTKAVKEAMRALLAEREVDRERADCDWTDVEDYEEVARPFVEHSDCEGRLTSEECAKLVTLFKKIIPFLKTGSYESEKIPELLTLFQTAAKYGLDVLYC